MIRNIPRYTSLILLLTSTNLLLLSCQSSYYYAMEKAGFHKRDLLVSGVEEARDTQEEAKEQFKSALEKFSAVAHFDGGALQEKYDQLSSELEQSKSQADAVRDRIKSVEEVAEALFNEWETELEQYNNEKMRRISQGKLTKTRQRYTKLIKVMKRVEQKIEPVLATFRDQVLFLKHDLNAQAIASIQSSLVSVESNVASLIKEMESAIREADTFIQAMSK
jgi:flagellar motility protein MotE (MotC chaperone)